MSKPWIHALSSARKFGGRPEDYVAIHDFMDSTKAHVADARHRLVLHNSFGIFIAEQVFGDILVREDGSTQRLPIITVTGGKRVSVRDVAEQHVLEDLGNIPSLAECLDNVPVTEEMSRHRRNVLLTNSASLRIVD